MPNVPPTENAFTHVGLWKAYIHNMSISLKYLKKILKLYSKLNFIKIDFSEI